MERHPSIEGLIIPGNLNSGHPTEKFIFQQSLPLEAEECGGQLHRDICTLSLVQRANALLALSLSCDSSSCSLLSILVNTAHPSTASRN